VTFLPIVERELRVRSRWRSTYVVRTGVAVLACAVAIVMGLAAIFAGPGIGKAMLLTLGWVTFGFCVVEGLRSTADVISEEKREGTLGLLFLTDLRGFDVVLGKFAASSLSSFYGLLAVVPALAIPVLLGGVTGAEFWRVVLALANALFFSLAAGMFISVLSREERRAWSATVALVAISMAALPILHHVTGGLAGVFSPTVAMLNAFEPAYSSAPRQFWFPLLVTNGIGWLFLVLASVLLPRTWQESGRASKRTSNRRSSGDARQRARIMAINPVWWLTSRHGDRGRGLWGCVITASAIGAGVWAWAEGDVDVGWWLFAGAVLMHIAITIWVATEACYSFADARSSGAMELLLSTPLSIRQIVMGQQLALKELFFRPIVVLVGVELVILAFQCFALRQAGTSIAAIVALIVFVCFSIGWFLLDTLAVSRVGMWFSLTSSKPTIALTRTILFMIVIPALFLPCASILGPGLMVAKSVIFLTWAQTRLSTHFRVAVTQRYDGPRPAREMWSRIKPPPLTMPR
jgi:ABC-type transport system involved in multi-copper enzyme maturation permease subunit